MTVFPLIILSSLLISLGALVGIFTLAMASEKLDKLLVYLMSLSAGALMGGAFIHLIPESFSTIDPQNASLMVLFAFVVFFLVEKLLHWHHCHKGGRCDIHTFGYMNLMGDSVHNFIDGLVLSAAYLADIRLGVVTTLAIALHEIPQEIGDFGVLLYAGWKKNVALVANFLVALTIVLGSLVGYFIASITASYVPYLTAFAAGGFIYIASSDLMPEIRKERSLKRSLQYFSVFIFGLLIMYLVKLINE